MSTGGTLSPHPAIYTSPNICHVRIIVSPPVAGRYTCLTDLLTAGSGALQPKFTTTVAGPARTSAAACGGPGAGEGVGSGEAR